MMFGVSFTILSIKNLLYAYFMTLFVYTVKWHIGHVFNIPSRQNAPTDRVLTSVILKAIEWAFSKVYPTKIPDMVHQGLLAPQSLCMNILFDVIMRAFGILPMVPLEFFPMLPLVANGTIGSQRTLNVSRQPMVPLVSMLPLVETLVPLVVPMVPIGKSNGVNSNIMINTSN